MKKILNAMPQILIAAIVAGVSVDAARTKQIQIPVAASITLLALSIVTTIAYLTQPKDEFWRKRGLRGEPHANRFRLFALMMMPASMTSIMAMWGIYIPPLASSEQALFLLIAALIGQVIQTYAILQIVKGMHWQGADQTYIHKIATKTPSKIQKNDKTKKQSAAKR